MLSRKTLHHIASIAALVTTGSTALADYDCYNWRFIPAATPNETFDLYGLGCNDTGGYGNLASLYTERSGNSYYLRVYREGANDEVIWTTAFAFNSADEELVTCSIWPSVEGYQTPFPATTNGRGPCRKTANGPLVKPHYVTIHGAVEFCDGPCN
jgi:hypothetical protein